MSPPAGDRAPRQVAFITHPVGSGGGIAAFTEQLLRRTAMHVDVVRVAYRRIYPAVTVPGREERRLSAGRGRGPVPYLPWTWVRPLRELHRARPSLVVAQWWHPFLAPFLVTLSCVLRRSGGRLLVVCHNGSPHESFPSSRLLTRMLLRRADRVCALSRYVADEIAGLVPSVDVQVLPHPPNLDGIVPGDVTVLRRRQPQRVLLFFGNVRPYKGLDDLIDAIALMRTDPPARLVVAGRFYQPVAPVRERISRLGLDDRVQLLDGYVDDADVPALFEAADLVVLPYRSASQSGVVGLAAQFGRPVVATAVGGLPDDIGARGVLVPPADPAALAGALDRALEKPPLPPVVFDWQPWVDAVAR
jgi:D-inositol-3-phosphate glycosyltransferase